MYNHATKAEHSDVINNLQFVILEPCYKKLTLHELYVNHALQLCHRKVDFELNRLTQKDGNK